MNQTTKHRYVMVDIETLGTAPTSAPIQEIAAVPFSVDPPLAITRDHFYTAISHADNIARGRLPDMSTCIWWLHQKRQPVMNSSVTVLQAFTQFLAWAHRHTDEQTQWFCQGTSFDPLILQDYFDMLLLKSPWKHYQWNDCRTLQKFFGVKRPQSANHHPIDDCLNQIASIHQCFIKLPPQKPNLCEKENPYLIKNASDIAKLAQESIPSEDQLTPEIEAALRTAVSAAISADTRVPFTGRIHIIMPRKGGEA